MSDNSATNGPRIITHHLEGYTITEDWQTTADGRLFCDCRITDAEGKFVRWYSTLEDASGYVRASVDVQRIRAEIRQQRAATLTKNMRNSPSKDDRAASNVIG